MKLELVKESEHTNEFEEHEKDEQLRDVKVEEIDTATKHKKDERSNQSKLKTAEQSDIQNTTAHAEEEIDAPIEKVLYTHAHGHTCTHKNCNLIILSNRGIIKPSRPSTEHYHLGNVCNKGGVKLLSPSDQLLTLKTEEESQPETSEQIKLPETTNPKRDITPPQTVNTTTFPPDNNTQPDNLPDSKHHEKDEQTLEAADGLLMLQKLKSSKSRDDREK